MSVGSLITALTSETSTSLAIKVISVVLVWLLASIGVKKGQDFVVRDKKIMKILARVGISERKFHAIDVLVDVGIYSVAFMITLYIFNLTSVIYTVLTAAGVLGIVIGFAVKDVASNAISGLIIKLNQPFRVGHYISLGDVSGTVKNIRTYSTELVSSDGVRTILPNSKLITSTVTNYSVEPNRRIIVKVNVSPGAHVKMALNVLEEVAKGEKRRLNEDAPQVFVENIGDYFVGLQLRFWTKKDDFWKTKQDVMLKIAEEFRKKKIKLAVPMRRTVTNEYD